MRHTLLGVHNDIHFRFAYLRRFLLKIHFLLSLTFFIFSLQKLIFFFFLSPLFFGSPLSMVLMSELSKRTLNVIRNCSYLQLITNTHLALSCITFKNVATQLHSVLVHQCGPVWLPLSCLEVIVVSDKFTDTQLTFNFGHIADNKILFNPSMTLSFDPWSTSFDRKKLADGLVWDVMIDSLKFF